MKTYVMLAQCLAGLVNVATETMKKKYIENYAKLLTNGLKSTKKMACRFQHQQPEKNIPENFICGLVVLYIKRYRFVLCKQETA